MRHEWGCNEAVMRPRRGPNESQMRPKWVRDEVQMRPKASPKWGQNGAWARPRWGRLLRPSNLRRNESSHRPFNQSSSSPSRRPNGGTTGARGYQIERPREIPQLGGGKESIHLSDSSNSRFQSSKRLRRDCAKRIHEWAADINITHQLFTESIVPPFENY